jgi:formamidopyrimidine-DNA glycosylase
MPELPEVETIRRDLIKRIVNKKIVHLQILLKRAVKGNFSDFKKLLSGNSFKKIDRIGKLLIFSLKKGDKFLLIHLKMTGQLVYCRGNKLIGGGHSDNNEIDCLPNKHTRAIFEFSDKGKLYFNDLRTFGYLKIVDSDELTLVKSKFGIEPLDQDFNYAFLKGLLKNRKTNIKAILLNQNLISGIGNIYADEILFVSRVRPDRLVNTLNDKEIKAIARNAKLILEKAIKERGTTFNNYVDADGNQGNFVKLLKVYGRTGEKCKRCGGVVKKMKVAGRGTHYCAECQS